MPVFSGNSDHVFHIYQILCENRDELKKYLHTNGIETLIHYPTPPHKQLAFKEWNHLSFPITEKIHQQTLSLPLNPSITLENAAFICEILNQF